MIRNNKIGSKWRTIWKAVGITILAFLLAELLSVPFSASISSIFSSPEKNDFVLSDFYAQIADRRPVREFSNRIVIVDIGRADRDGIAEIIETVSLCDPLAIAIDINFDEPHEDDTRLLRSLDAGCPVILPLGLTADNRTINTYHITERPFFYDSIPKVLYGAVNFPGKYERSSIREFPVKFKLIDGKDQLSFVAAISKEVDPLSFSRLINRGHEVETIDYASLEIPVISLSDIFENPEIVAGKVIMIGAINEAADMHATPVTRSMSGLAIHSYALSTILQGNYFNSLSKHVDYIVASILCFFIVLYTISITAKVKGLILRVLQIILIYAIVRIGYELYVSHKLVVNFTITLLMVAFGMFAIDVWNGSIGLSEFLTKWVKRLKNKFHHEPI